MEDKIKRFNTYLNSLPFDEMQTINEEELKKTEEDFKQFKKAFLNKECNFCGNTFTHFSIKKPCFHWLLNETKGFKPRKHFPLLYTEKSFIQINTYLRWVANSGDAWAMNINDLKEEQTQGKIIEETIRHKETEWSFSCSKNDYDGHKNRTEGQTPHYHFQMRVNGQVVISYGAFHIPFTDYDLFMIDVRRGKFDRLIGGHNHSAGMQSIYDVFTPEQLLDAMKKSSNADDRKKQFRLQTVITAEKGTTISGDKIYELMEEHKRTGIPMAKLIQKLKNVSYTTTITPGKAVPEMTPRTVRKKR
jgi:hypothetical protein